MTKISNVENGAVYEGYDSLAASQWCTPSFLGCSACVSASAIKGQVTITIELRTPFGNVSKSFSFNANTSFTWQPFSKFKVTVSIANFNEDGGVFSFDLGLNPCIQVPFIGWKCFNFSHTFSVPVLVAGIQSEIDDTHFTSLLTLHASGALHEGCHCDDTATPLLKGDIYNNYLSSQAAFPTVPVTKCIPIPTVQCIPTLTSCVTGISPICLTQQDAEANPNAAIPTLPVNQCVPTASCIPTISCIPTVSCTGIPFICNGVAAQAGVGANVEARTLICFPTFPPICRSLSSADASANAAAIPTLPVNQCVPTVSCIPTVSCVPTLSCTGIPFICNSAALQAGSTANAAAIPTLPVNQCIPTVSCVPTLSCIPTASCTGIPFICNDAVQSTGNLNAGPPHTVLCFPTLPQACRPTGVTGDATVAAIPTLPVNQCIPTVSCVPTLSCIPTASCTGIPFICNGVAAQAGNSVHVQQGFPTMFCAPTNPAFCRHLGAANQVNTVLPTLPPVTGVPTLPANQCVPTVSCVPTLSCIPTASCTGIPFIC